MSHIVCRYVESACIFAKPQKRGCVAVIVADKAVCRALPAWQSTHKEQNGSMQNGHAARAAKPYAEDPNCGLLLNLLKTELKDVLVRYEVPLAIALVEGPWTPESGNCSKILRSTYIIIF